MYDYEAEPPQMIKLPKYKGCLIIEYIPVVFKTSAICCRVFVPEVPSGVEPTVKNGFQHLKLK